MSKIIRTTTRKAEDAILNRREFRTSGALKGTWDRSYSTGYLNDDEARAYRTDRQSGEIYTVYSYGTPIAWWTDQYGWHIVRQRFSMTTSKHQSNLHDVAHEMGVDLRKYINGTCELY